MKRIAGIYKITNIINNKIYIGSSNNIYKRKREHFSSLKNGTHCNIHLQRAYNIHGKSNFKFEVVEVCEEKDLLKIEQIYLDKYFDKGINCYNENPIACKPPSQQGKIPWNKGKHGIYSKETLQKISNSKKGMKYPEEARQKLINIARSKIFDTSKKVLCVETNTIFKSIKEAERITGVCRSNIPKCCNGTRKTAGGYHWEWVNN